MARSEADGRFAIGLAGAGSFVLRVEAGGFSPYQTVVALSSGAPVRLDIRLTLSPVSSEVTVSAEAGSAVAAADSPQRVVAIGAGEIGEKSTTVLTETARGEAGVAEQRTSPGMGAFFVRGMTGKNVAVYRDGIRYTTSAQRGGVSTFQNLIDPAWLETVEMVKGPSSAQFGSDSMGGAVHLVSQTPGFSGSGTTLRWEQGFFYQSSANALGEQTRLSWAGSRVAGQAAIAARRVNRVRPGEGLDSRAAVTRFLGLDSRVFGTRLQDTAFTQYGGMVHVQAQLSPFDHLSVHYERGQQDGGRRYDQLLGGDGNLVADLRNLMLDFGYLRWQRFGAGWLERAAVSASYTAQREERVNQGGQGDPLASIAHQYERLAAWGVQAQAEKRAGSHSVSGGLEGYYEKMRSPAYNWDPASGATTLTRPRVPDGAEYFHYGIYVQDAWTPPALSRLRVSGALRWGGGAYRSRAANSPAGVAPLWPDDSLSADGWTGRLGAVLRLGGGFSMHGLYSRGFRVPNMTDLGTLGLQGNGAYETSASGVAGLGATVGGHPVEQLVPETADNWEGGAAWQTARIRIEASAFYLRLRNTVVSQPLILPPGAVGQPLGDQIISAQLPSGAVFVPVATPPVLVRTNLGGAALRGVEQSLKFALPASLHLSQNFTWLEARDSETGAPPDIEPGVPAPALNASLLWSPPARRLWVEAYATAADRQSRLSSLALADRRIGAARSAGNIASFFRNGATVRGLVSGGKLIATGETLAQVQQRVLGPAVAAPMYTALAGYAVFGIRAGFPTGSRSEVMVDFFNLTDRNWRGMGWGVDADGRGITVRWKIRLEPRH
jgi:outer membrane receptor protein involved in Fe transport